MQAEQALAAARHRADTEAQLRLRAEDDLARARAEVERLRADLQDARRRADHTGGGLDSNQLRELVTAAVAQAPHHTPDLGTSRQDTLPSRPTTYRYWLA
ncbi:hypothetical protein [Pseudonocardia lacus]|uniref:hypothetical protein n=1 Tax=Pseudonocardia lacus TaxID=2835865 RepID=UPI001BDC14D6|nr:hypothetical protein [Pseudonocardia lacus]